MLCLFLQVGTQLNPDANVAAPSKDLPNWVIPVCVVGAILLLVLIVFCLYKVSACGTNMLACLGNLSVHAISLPLMHFLTLLAFYHLRTFFSNTVCSTLTA